MSEEDYAVRAAKEWLEFDYAEDIEDAQRHTKDCERCSRFKEELAESASTLSGIIRKYAEEEWASREHLIDTGM